MEREIRKTNKQTKHSNYIKRKEDVLGTSSTTLEVFCCHSYFGYFTGIL